MNRLILVGNGFDLALGLKTSYQDFLIWLMKKYINEAAKSRGIQSKDVNHANGYVKNKLFSVEWTNSLLFEKNVLEKITEIGQLNEYKSQYRIKFANETKFFKRLISHFGQKGWVDVERIFYDMLLECLRPNDYTIEDLNSDLSFLKYELQEYLTEVNSNPIDWDGIGHSMTEEFNAPFVPHLNSTFKKVKNQNSSTQICFVNFNYTNTVDKFVRNFQAFTKSKIEVIPIHGTLQDIANPPIFGFGDEVDDKYKEIENRNENKFFEHIKSFKYLKTKNYHDLIRFVDSSDYQVYIYGHSCGLSDRTMLREIFEHQNCCSIKIYFHIRLDGSNDFEEKTMEISRHFTDKGVMRRKVINKEYSKAIPQNNL